MPQKSYWSYWHENWAGSRAWWYLGLLNFLWWKGSSKKVTVTFTSKILIFSSMLALLPGGVGYLKIMENHEKSWKNEFFVNLSGVSWLYSYMSKMTSWASGLGLICKLPVPITETWSFCHPGHGIPENPGKSWKIMKKLIFWKSFRRILVAFLHV